MMTSSIRISKRCVTAVLALCTSVILGAAHAQLNYPAKPIRLVAPQLPALPTPAELGIAGFEGVGGHAMWLPAGVPREIVARLHQEMMRAVNSPEVKARLEAGGAEIIANTLEQVLGSVCADLDKWADKKTGIRTT